MQSGFNGFFDNEGGSEGFSYGGLISERDISRVKLAIDGAVTRIAKKLRDENVALKERLAFLESENDYLKMRLRTAKRKYGY